MPSGPLDKVPILSPRERQILGLALRGKLDKEIAEEIGVSIHTLRTYWVRIRRKLGSANRVALVQRWTEMQAGSQPLADWTPFRKWEYDFRGGRIEQFETIADQSGRLLPPRRAVPRVVNPEDYPTISERLACIIGGRCAAAAWSNRMISRDGTRRIYFIAKAVRDPQGRLQKIMGISFELETMVPSPKLEAGGLWIALSPDGRFYADVGVRGLLGVRPGSEIRDMGELLSESALHDREQLEKRRREAAAKGGGVVEEKIRIDRPEQSFAVEVLAISQPTSIGEVFEVGQMFRLQDEATAPGVSSEG